jgi:hypothetical protein
VLKLVECRILERFDVCAAGLREHLTTLVSWGENRAYLVERSRLQSSSPVSVAASTPATLVFAVSNSSWEDVACWFSPLILHTTISRLRLWRSMKV